MAVWGHGRLEMQGQNISTDHHPSDNLGVRVKEVRTERL
jgi:hypothetical protein